MAESELFGAKRGEKVTGQCESYKFITNLRQEAEIIPSLTCCARSSFLSSHEARAIDLKG